MFLYNFVVCLSINRLFLWSFIQLQYLFLLCLLWQLNSKYVLLEYPSARQFNDIEPQHNIIWVVFVCFAFFFLIIEKFVGTIARAHAHVHPHWVIIFRPKLENSSACFQRERCLVWFMAYFMLPFPLVGNMCHFYDTAEVEVLRWNVKWCFSDMQKEEIGLALSGYSSTHSATRDHSHFLTLT